jgi:hypothetical protein
MAALGWRDDRPDDAHHEPALAGISKTLGGALGGVVGRKRVVEWPIQPNPPKRSLHPCLPRGLCSKHFAGCSSVHPRILCRRLPFDHQSSGHDVFCSKTCSIDASDLLACHGSPNQSLVARLAARMLNALDAGTRTATISKHGPFLYLLSFIASVPSSRLPVIGI